MVRPAVPCPYPQGTPNCSSPVCRVLLSHSARDVYLASGGKTPASAGPQTETWPMGQHRPGPLHGSRWLFLTALGSSVLPLFVMPTPILPPPSPAAPLLLSKSPFHSRVLLVGEAHFPVTSHPGMYLSSRWQDRGKAHWLMWPGTPGKQLVTLSNKQEVNN